MKKIFIDTENISDYDCLKSIGISKKDEIVLFLTRNSKPLKAENLYIIHSFDSKVKTLLFEPSGHNALDFHIVTHLGLKYSKNNEYFIVSNDKGFEASKNHFNMLGYNNVNLVTELNNANKNKPNKNKNKNKDKNKNKSNNSKCKDKNDNTTIIDFKKTVNISELELKRIFKNTKDKSNFHNKLVSEFGEEGKTIYREYKKKYS